VVSGIGNRESGGKEAMSMTLVEVCEPLFQCVCRLNRSARKGVSAEMGPVREEIKAALAECKERAEKAKMAEGYAKAEIILVYFADSMIRAGRFGFAKQWQDLAQEKGQTGGGAGDEDFFDQLDVTLKDPSEDATQRLAVFYTCMGLGFTGWYAGQPEVLRKKMLEVSSRLRGKEGAMAVDADRAARICPEAYEGVNTRDFVRPPAQRLAGVGIVLAGLALTMFAANVTLYLDKRGQMQDSLRALIEKSKPAGGATATGGKP